MSFSHNNMSILGKPEGKEKQLDSLEYNVSKATALWFYQRYSKARALGGTACQVPGEILQQHSPYNDRD